MQVNNEARTLHTAESRRQVQSISAEPVFVEEQSSDCKHRIGRNYGRCFLNTLSTSWTTHAPEEGLALLLSLIPRTRALLIFSHGSEARVLDLVAHVNSTYSLKPSYTQGFLHSPTEVHERKPPKHLNTFIYFILVSFHSETFSSSQNVGKLHCVRV